MIRAAAVSVLLGAAAFAQGPLDCRPCHPAIAASYARTAHARASATASPETVLGPFDRQMRTKADGVYFRMERRDGRLYQTGVRPGFSQTEPFDLVIGSGRRGQSYLYWRNGLLFQLPVSYHAASKTWINSPGYVDGAVHFGRAVPPQCLDCHAAGFRLEPAVNGPRYASGFTLGIPCAKCHGEAATHQGIRRPSGIDLCARCHSGLENETHGEPDVHGNQVGLLRSSRCFQKSGSMTCGTCHDIHRTERDPAALSAKCGICHQPSACPSASKGGACVDCHMPQSRSKLIEVQSYRSHRIAVYK